MPFTTLDEFGFHHRLAATPGLALVLFVSERCGSCRAWKRMLGGYAGRHRSAMTFFEVDAGRAQALVREFGVFHLPALFLYRGGRYHRAIECAAPAAFDRAIDAALAEPSQEPP